MKAYRNVGGNVVEIIVDLDLNGDPILPPDTTVDPRPEAQEGHYVTVVGNRWVQIEIPVVVKSLDVLRQEAMNRWSAYRSWLLEQPVEFDGALFDGDEQARIRLNQAISIVTMDETRLPPAWIAKDNTPYPITSFDVLKELGMAVYDAFSVRFFDTNTIRAQLLAADTEEALNAVEIPSIPNNMF